MISTQSDFYKAIVRLAESHVELSAAEYTRNPRFNDQHPAYQAEQAFLDAVEAHFGTDAASWMIANDWKNK